MGLLSRTANQEPQPVSQEQQDAETARIMASIGATRKERDALANEVERLRNENSVLNRQVEFLERNHDAEVKQKEYWQRHSTYLHSKLGSIQDLASHLFHVIEGVLAEANKEANTIRQPSTATADQQKQVENGLADALKAAPNPNDGWGKPQS